MFVYDVNSGVEYTSNATPGTADVYLAFRQTLRNFSIAGLFFTGKGAGLTALSGIVHRVRRWTTAGSGGTTITPSPRRIGTVADTVVADSATALTAGTVSGAQQLAVGHGAAGPGGWMARDQDSKIEVAAGSSDELDIYNESGTASLLFETTAEIEE